MAQMLAGQRVAPAGTPRRLQEKLVQRATLASPRLSVQDSPAAVTERALALCLFAWRPASRVWMTDLLWRAVRLSQVVVQRAGSPLVSPLQRALTHSPLVRVQVRPARELALARVRQ